MWEDTFKDLNLPKASFEKFAFEDGYNKVYTELTPLDEEDEKPKEEKPAVKKPTVKKPAAAKP